MNLFDILSQGHHAIDGYLVATGLCSLRLYVTFYIFPPTGEDMLQGVLRNAIVVMFSAFVTYGQPIEFIDSLHGPMLVEIGLREAMIGLVIGFSAAIVFWVAEAAGVYMDDITGYNNAQMTNPLRTETVTVIGTLLAKIASTAFWALGGMTFLLGAVYESFHWWPIAARAPDLGNILEAFAMRQTDTLMQGVAKLAAPMVLLLVLVDLSFGFASRAAPKLELMMLSQPVKGAMAALMLALFVGLFVDQVTDQVTLRHLSADMRELARPDAGKAADKNAPARSDTMPRAASSN